MQGILPVDVCVSAVALFIIARASWLTPPRLSTHAGPPYLPLRQSQSGGHRAAQPSPGAMPRGPPPVSREPLATGSSRLCGAACEAGNTRGLCAA